jgi:hypothetical protein
MPARRADTAPAAGRFGRARSERTADHSAAGRCSGRQTLRPSGVCVTWRLVNGVGGVAFPRLQLKHE